MHMPTPCTQNHRSIRSTREDTNRIVQLIPEDNNADGVGYPDFADASNVQPETDIATRAI